MPCKNQCTFKNMGNGKRCMCNFTNKMGNYDTLMCYFHYNTKFGKATRVIQNIYRNNKIRNAINILKILPYDLQNKILFHMRENALIKKHHHEVIERIILRRNLVSQKKRIFVRILGIENVLNISPFYIKIFLDEIFQLLKLISKYKEIISFNSHKYLASEIGQVDQFILKHELLDEIGMENEHKRVVVHLIDFCRDIDVYKTKNKEKRKIQQFYCENILGYDYLI